MLPPCKPTIVNDLIFRRPKLALTSTVDTQADALDEELAAVRQLVQLDITPCLAESDCIPVADWQSQDAWTAKGPDGAVQKTLTALAPHIKVGCLAQQEGN